MIVRWRCDKQMAEKKGVRRNCNRKCRECLCGVGMDEWGHEHHRSDMPEGCDNIRSRNMEIAYGRDRTGKRGRPVSSGGKQL